MMNYQAAILATAICAVAAQGQAQTSAGSVELEEIIVTAQRKEQSLQDAGLAITAITGAEVLNRGISKTEDLNILVPALTITDRGGANSTFFLRGVGNFALNGYTDPALAFNYDGVYIGRPTSTKAMFYDLGRIEVLKGPQGTLYGRNATAGAINVIPAAPDPESFSANLSFSYGNKDAIDFQGAVNVPVGESAALRIAGMYTERDGFESDGSSDDDRQAIRGQFLVEPSENLSIRVAADYAEIGGMGRSAHYEGRYVPNFAGFPITLVYIPSGFPSGQGLFDPASEAYRTTLFAGLSGRTVEPFAVPPRINDDYFGVNAEINWSTEAGTLTIIPAYRESTLDNIITVPGFHPYIQEKDEQFSIEARFAGERIGMLDYIIGGQYFDEDIKANYSFSHQALASYQDLTTGTESYAVFGNLTANLTDEFRIIGGIRYTDDTKKLDADVRLRQVICVVPIPPGCPRTPLLPLVDGPEDLPPVFPRGPVPLIFVDGIPVGAILNVVNDHYDTTLKYDKVTWRAAVEYDLLETSLFYASFETGYRSGGYSMSAGNETFEPEFIDAYTIGLKNRLFDNRLQLNIEAFWWDYKNQQVSHNGVDEDGFPSFFTENVGESSNKGVEVEAMWLATDTTLLSAAVHYLDAAYDEYSFTEPRTNPIPPPTGCDIAPAVTVLPHGGTSDVWSIDCSGKPAYSAPDWIVNLGIQQTFVLDTFEVVARVNTQYRSENFTGFEYLEMQRQDDFWRTDASISVGPQGGNWQVTGWVRNIEDDRVRVGGSTYRVGGGVTNVTSYPITYGIRLNYGF